MGKKTNRRRDDGRRTPRRPELFVLSLLVLVLVTSVINVPFTRKANTVPQAADGLTDVRTKCWMLANND